MELGLNSYHLPPECVLPTATPHRLSRKQSTLKTRELQNWRTEEIKRGHNYSSERITLRYPSKYSRIRNTHVLFWKIYTEYYNLFKGNVKLSLEVKRNTWCCRGKIDFSKIVWRTVNLCLAKQKKIYEVLKSRKKKQYQKVEVSFKE